METIPAAELSLDATEYGDDQTLDELVRGRPLPPAFSDRFPYLLRHKWLEMSATAGLTAKRAPSRYYNGGFVGVPGRLRHVLPVWESLLDAAKAFGYDTTQLASTDRT